MYHHWVGAQLGHLRGVLDAFSDGLDPILKEIRGETRKGVNISDISKMAKNDDFWHFLGPKSTKNPPKNF